MKLRGALLGAGNIALRGHAPQWIGDEVLRQSVEIVAVADLSPANLDAARAALPAARRYASAEELLAREQLDFCDICTPPFTHLALVQAAAARHVHVVCEKPIAPDLAAAEAVARAVRGAGLVFAPCHQYHHSPLWLGVKERLPRLGRIYLAEYEVSRTEANPGNPNWTPTWRTDPKLAGGGILFDHGAHIFYQLRSALGEPERVQASVRTLRHTAYGVEDTAFVTLEREEWLAQVRLTWAARKREIRFRFVGEQGELSGDDQQLRLHAEKTEDVSFAEGMSKDSAHSAWFAPLFRSFVDGVRAGDTSTEGLDEAVYVSRVIACAYESSRQGRALAMTALPAEATPVVAAPTRA